MWSNVLLWCSHNSLHASSILFLDFVDRPALHCFGCGIIGDYTLCDASGVIYRFRMISVSPHCAKSCDKNCSSHTYLTIGSSKTCSTFLLDSDVVLPFLLARLLGPGEGVGGCAACTVACYSCSFG